MARIAAAVVAVALAALPPALHGRSTGGARAAIHRAPFAP
jgi:hypothetical protein